LREILNIKNYFVEKVLADLASFLKAAFFGSEGKIFR